MSVRIRSCGRLLAVLALLSTQMACDGPGSTPAAIVIVSPKSGDVLAVDTTVAIQWQIRQEMAQVNIAISRDGRQSWDYIATGVDAAVGTHPWLVDRPISANCHIRIRDAEDETVSAETTWPFEIASPFLSVVSPNGGEKWAMSTTRSIRWAQFGVENVKIEYCIDWDGTTGTWQTVQASLPAGANPGAYPWLVPGDPGTGDGASTQCRVKISDAGVGPLTDKSYGDFEISKPSLRLLAPSGSGLELALHEELTITWEAVGVDQVRIDISRDGKSTWTALTAPIPSYSGEYTWSATPGGVVLPQDACYVRVVNSANEALQDVCIFPFTIKWDDVYRVKWNAPPGGDGRIWETAFRHPQQAMDVAGSVNDIWVAEGTYNVENLGDPQVLEMADDVDVYGGFSGSEYDFTARSPGGNETTLDGGDTVTHVVYASNVSGARLDGFQVTGGRAQGVALANRRGAGMYCDSVSGLVVANCVFRDNAAATSSEGYGGGMYCGDSTVTVTKCQFISNSAGSGGGAACYYSSGVSFSKCLFQENMSNYTASSGGGGGLHFRQTSGTAVNCVFWKNSAYRGGGFSSGNTSSVASLVNCTIVANSASYGGGVYDYWGEDTVIVRNSIAWDNTGGDIYNFYYGYLTNVSYSCLMRSYPGISIIIADPEFRDEEAGEFHLTSGSPCIDAGTPSGAPAGDMDDDNARDDGMPDIGAYEY